MVLFGIDYRDTQGALAHIKPEDILNFQAGKSFVIEYIGGAQGQGNAALTAADALALESAGLSIVSVYENRPSSGGGMTDTDSSGHYTSSWVDYFSQAGQGTIDAQNAINGAISAGQFTGAIYFAIDLDPAKSTDPTTGLNRISEAAALNLIDKYFEDVSAYFNAYNQQHGTSYQIGVYGAGDTLSKVVNDPLVTAGGTHAFTWLAGATGWAGSSTYTTWDLKQYDNDQFQLDGRNVDLDQSSSQSFGAWDPAHPIFPFSNDAQAQVEVIYIGYFGRAGDPGGTNYWVNQLNGGGDSVVPGLTGVAAAFSLAPEASTEYPLLANPSTASQANIQTFINTIYQNLFDRAADSGGLAYWTAEVNGIIATHDSLTIANGIGQMAVSIALGAQGTDQTSLTNKVTVAEWLTEKYQAAGVHTFPTQSAEFAFAHSLIASVTSDPATVIGAEAQHIPLM